MAPSQTCEVVNVTSRNWRGASCALLEAIKDADFVSIDTEMSGIGNSRDRNAKSIDKRYQQVSELAASRAIIALGVACFKKCVLDKPSSGDGGLGTAHTTTYTAAVFNISTMPRTKYWIEPSAATFLAEHGFDFNSQIQYGVRFTPGFTYPEHESPTPEAHTTPEDAPMTGNKRRKKQSKNERGDAKDRTAYFQDDAIDSKRSLRELFRLLMTRKVVVHNGFLDVIYLYHALYAPLPPTLSTFVADLCEIFSHGIVDTKYIAEYEHRDKATFLEYLFRKYQRSLQSKALHLRIVPWNVLQSQNPSEAPFETSVPTTGLVSARDINYVVFGEDTRSDCTTDAPTTEGAAAESSTADVIERAGVCKNYAVHGVCFRNRAGMCPASHDLDDILDAEERRATPRAKATNPIAQTTLARESTSQGLGSNMHSAAIQSDQTGSLSISAAPASNTTATVVHIPAAGAQCGVDATAATPSNRDDTVNSTIVASTLHLDPTEVPDSKAKRRRKRKRKNKQGAGASDVAAGIRNIPSATPNLATAAPTSTTTPTATLSQGNVAAGAHDTSRGQPVEEMPMTRVTSAARCQGHRAGFDAFMTGFCYAVYCQEYDDAALKSFTNKIYLVGCQRPLLLRKSAFSTPSDLCRAAQLRNRTRTQALTAVHVSES
eukprot:m.886728 g.886728  ORF g.886728 m.886728 type:complete len:659 (+) comp23629_c0_seq4:501-2477(+)